MDCCSKRWLVLIRAKTRGKYKIDSVIKVNKTKIIIFIKLILYCLNLININIDRNIIVKIKLIIAEREKVKNNPADIIIDENNTRRREYIFSPLVLMYK